MANLQFNLHEIILLLTGIECLVIAACLNLFNTRQEYHRKVLGFSFINYSVILFCTALIWNHSVQTTLLGESLALPILISTSLLLQGPLLYFYLRSFRANNLVFSPSLLVHGVPAALALIVIFLFEITTYKWLPWHWQDIDYNQSVRFLWAWVRCFPLLYVFACIYQEMKNRLEMQQVQSSVSTTETQLMSLFLIGTLASWGWSFLGYFAGNYLSIETNNLIGRINDYLNILLINLICVFGFITTRKFIHNLATTPPIDSSTQELMQEFNESIAKIQTAITHKKLHLQKQITLDEFAEQIGLSAADTSSILNRHFKSNFFEFINLHRIEEAKRLLSDRANENTSIQDIIAQAGFSSSSAFHRFFKRFVEKTPSQYRAEQLGPKA